MLPLIWQKVWVCSLEVGDLCSKETFPDSSYWDVHGPLTDGISCGNNLNKTGFGRVRGYPWCVCSVASSRSFWKLTAIQREKYSDIGLKHTEFQVQLSSIQFSSVMSDSLWPHGLQHTRLPCPSLTPGVYANSCPSSRWCHPATSFSVIPFSSQLQSFPASGSFQMSQFFTSGGQSIRASASASVLSGNIQDWFPLGWTGWISQESSPIPHFKSINASVLSFLYSPSHICTWLLEKP